MTSLADRDRAHLWHPYTQMQIAPAPLPIASARGVFLFTEDGRKILDGISSWWVNVHGHSHPHLAAAISRQAANLEHVIFAGFTHEPAVALAEQLIRILPPAMNRVFYSDNGSTAVEAALKMAYQFWSNRGQEKRRTFIALENGYHGDTIGAMSASAPSVFTHPFSELMFDVVRTSAPYSYRMQMPDDEATDFCLRELERRLDAEGDRVAAVIVEPILQGAGGMILSQPRFLAGVRALCDRAGTLFIADEVLTGFGRTGRMFACEHASIAPDIICLSKGLTGGMLPLGATVTTESVYEGFLSEDRMKTFFHGHSYTANPLGCAVALASLELFEKEATLQNVSRLEALMTRRLTTLRQYPGVGEVRGIGGVGVIELSDAKGTGYLASIGPKLAAEFLRRGLLLRPLGIVLYFMPPLCITEDEANWSFDQIEEVLSVPLW